MRSVVAATQVIPRAFSRLTIKKQKLSSPITCTACSGSGVAFIKAIISLWYCITSFPTSEPLASGGTCGNGMSYIFPNSSAAFSCFSPHPLEGWLLRFMNTNEILMINDFNRVIAQVDFRNRCYYTILQLWNLQSIF